jgi:hypothetical protein
MNLRKVLNDTNDLVPTILQLCFLAQTLEN